MKDYKDYPDESWDSHSNVSCLPDNIKRIKIRPNAIQCEGCPDWDDVNGCWIDVEDVDSCPEIGENGYYPIGNDDEYWEELFMLEKIEHPEYETPVIIRK